MLSFEEGIVKIRSAFAATLMMAIPAGFGVVASASNAAAVTPECVVEDAYDKVCLFEDGGQLFGGRQRFDFYSRTSWANITYDGTSLALYRGDGVTTNVSGAINMDPDSRIAFYYNSNYAGPCFTLRPNKGVFFRAVTLANGKSANDNMNSHQFNAACGTLYG